jgi:hypothetical protein
MAKKQIKDLWGWLNEITLHKTPIEEISEESWDSWNSYIIHRYVSMDVNYIELVNYIQTIPYENKKQIYTIYSEMIPKKKVFLKYISAKKKKKNVELADYVAKYFECSLGEADEYIDILQKTGVRGILYKMGIEDKTIDKLLKK